MTYSCCNCSGCMLDRDDSAKGNVRLSAYEQAFHNGRMSESRQIMVSAKTETPTRSTSRSGRECDTACRLCVAASMTMAIRASASNSVSSLREKGSCLSVPGTISRDDASCKARVMQGP